MKAKWNWKDVVEVEAVNQQNSRIKNQQTKIIKLPSFDTEPYPTGLLGSHSLSA